MLMKFLWSTNWGRSREGIICPIWGLGSMRSSLRLTYVGRVSFFHYRSIGITNPSACCLAWYKIHLAPLRCLNSRTLVRPFRCIFCRLNPISKFPFCFSYKEMRALCFLSLASSPITRPQFGYISSSQWRQRTCCMALGAPRSMENL